MRTFIVAGIKAAGNVAVVISEFADLFPLSGGFGQELSLAGNRFPCGRYNILASLQLEIQLIPSHRVYSGGATAYARLEKLGVSS